ncbi:MAG TPA: hypothetical protein PKK74_02925 [Candidatus Methanoculleus thermohydrogenotrophicum]|jgi:hypothetical protein|nr:hypothetical protein [Candidatus Methanoculleus thermohydrogenotrophicum]NLM81535.1 hypothetical protein [Candidatus Methanoculleus thermohydrogenotrophicum]HOB17635.1 hypothetical protein [Candidatus Methanoculleus thermohydrogenotrophicum]HPZ37343.1 hypothetical protein [Candidatus Methanoculleus thermohydrogenotrophicum]HQC91138.1 hypothetical protein [Candidatus Methanoculleus thermohydrogenotrophicum]
MKGNALVFITEECCKGAPNCYDQALAASPDDSSALNGRAMALVYLNRSVEVVKYYERLQR